MHAIVTTLTLLQMLCSWLPLSLGDATYYVPTCSSMSYFLASGELSTSLCHCIHNISYTFAAAACQATCHVAAMLSLGFFFLHTASMVISFEGLAAGHALHIALPPAFHLITSLLVSACLLYPRC